MDMLIDIETNNSKRMRGRAPIRYNAFRTFCRRSGAERKLIELECERAVLKAWMLKCGVWDFKDYILLPNPWK